MLSEAKELAFLVGAVLIAALMVGVPIR